MPLREIEILQRAARSLEPRPNPRDDKTLVIIQRCFLLDPHSIRFIETGLPRWAQKKTASVKEAVITYHFESSEMLGAKPEEQLTLRGLRVLTISGVEELVDGAGILLEENSRSIWRRLLDGHVDPQDKLDWSKRMRDRIDRFKSSPRTFVEKLVSRNMVEVTKIVT